MVVSTLKYSQVTYDYKGKGERSNAFSFSCEAILRIVGDYHVVAKRARQDELSQQ